MSVLYPVGIVSRTDASVLPLSTQLQSEPSWQTWESGGASGKSVQVISHWSANRNPPPLPSRNMPLFNLTVIDGGDAPPARSLGPRVGCAPPPGVSVGSEKVSEIPVMPGASSLLNGDVNTMFVTVTPPSVVTFVATVADETRMLAPASTLRTHSCVATFVLPVIASA